MGPAEVVGRCFGLLEPLTAYRYDLLGSLIGIGLFTLLSFLWAPSLAWGVLAGIALVVDDMCDAGGTFLGLGDLLLVALRATLGERVGRRRQEGQRTCARAPFDPILDLQTFLHCFPCGVS